MRRIKFLLVFVLLALLLSAAMGPMHAQEPHIGSSIDQIRWLTYNDPRFDFTIEYPSNWTVQPRTDNPDATGEVLVFAGPEREKGRSPYIAIGHYLYAVKSRDSLADWTARYPLQFPASEIQISETREFLVDGAEAVYIRGRSPLTEYQYTNIRQGRVVWFAWANFGDSADTQDFEIYNHMAASLKFGDQSPISLQDIYGSDFRPNGLNSFSSGSAKSHHLAALLPQRPQIASNWWSPVLNSYGNQWPITCGSAMHRNGSYYAADVGAPENWQVRTANVGQVEFTGWNPSGYGNLVKMGPYGGGVGYRHYYAHLIGITWPATQVGNYIDRDVMIGWVGGTGGVPVHLHFHVQDGQYESISNGVTLVGMYGFRDNPDDPYYPCNDGVSHYNCAWMGR